MPVKLRMPIFSLAVAALACPLDAYSKEPSDSCSSGREAYEVRQGWHVTWENDALSRPKSDQYYTQGAQIGYTFKKDGVPSFVARTDSWLCNIVESLPFFEPAHATVNSHTGFLGQQLFTPQDKNSPDAIPDDRPYAGWLYAGNRLEMVSLLANSDSRFRRWRTTTLELQMGVVGPPALGEVTQDKFHTLMDRLGLDTDPSRGWAHEIPKKFGVQAHLNHSGRVHARPLLFGVSDLIVSSSVALGNLQTYGEAGLVARFGRNMGPLVQRAIVPSVADMPRKLTQSEPMHEGQVESTSTVDAADIKACGLLGAQECYLFAGVNLRVVGRNIFVDGAPSGAGSAIYRDPLVYDTTFGARMRWQSARVDLIQTIRSREFSPSKANPLDAEGRHAFTSLNVTCYGRYGGSGRSQLTCPLLAGAIVALVATQRRSRPPETGLQPNTQ